ncbi:MAG: MBOAT family protein [Lachnospiraceae bacterium]|nr:MBOAT family protein [Lachnospiraceae bacterium]
MSYTSLAFAAFTLGALIIYYLMPSRFRYLVLLAFSYAFYIITCGKYVIYILVTTCSTYIATRFMGGIYRRQKEYLAENKETLTRDEKKQYKEKSKSGARRIMVLTLLLNFGVLGVLKYADFTIANINMLRLTLFNSTGFLGFLNPVLPLGISFYTFQSMGYVIDVYFGRYEAEKNPFKLALYVSYFPQIIQGPISRFNELSKTLFAGAAFNSESFCIGLYRILWGLFKKLVVADRLAAYVDGAVNHYTEAGGTYLLLAVFFYSMQIYGDFSGGIDITIGVSKLFGVSVAENFDRPFFSKSVAEYWRRWHITLGTWFKDYIFYPITVSKRVLELSKKSREKIGEGFGKRLPIYLAMFTVWFATGLWHGAEWRYVVWGLLNFVILTFSTEAKPLYDRLNGLLKWEGSFAHRCFAVFRTFWIMSFLRVFDLSSGGVKMALVIIKKSLTDICPLTLENIELLGLDRQELTVGCIGILIMLIYSLRQRKGSIEEAILKLPIAARWGFTALACMAVVIFGSYGMGYNARDFIYLQF